MFPSVEPAFVHRRDLKGVTFMGDTQYLKYANAINYADFIMLFVIKIDMGTHETHGKPSEHSTCPLLGRN